MVLFGFSIGRQIEHLLADAGFTRPEQPNVGKRNTNRRLYFAA
jgi:hypothetical protein